MTPSFELPMKKTPLSTLYLLLLATVLSILLTVQCAEAHRVWVFAYVSGPDIVVEGNFGKNRPAQKSRVLVFSQQSEEKLLEGITDSEGRFRFTRPTIKPGDSLKIILDCGQGHQARWVLTPEDLADQAPAASEPTPPSTASPSPQASIHPFSAEQTRIIFEMIEQAVARETEPIQQMLAQYSNQGPSMTEIIGGIGWIIGVGGLLAALKKRT